MIKHKGYTILSNGFGRFDLFKDVIRTKKKSGEKYNDLAPLAFALSFDRAVVNMIDYLLIDNEDITDIKEYISEYKESVNDLKDFLNKYNLKLDKCT